MVFSVIANNRGIELFAQNMDMNETDRLLKKGSTNGYDWLVSTDTLDDVLQLCPEVVLGKYLAVTSFDSGPLLLSEEQKSAGWTSNAGIAYSPEI